MKSYSKQDAHYMHIILFELDLYVKFPSLLLLKFLSDLKRTIISLSVFSWFLCRIAQLVEIQFQFLSLKIYLSVKLFLPKLKKL